MQYPDKQTDKEQIIIQDYGVEDYEGGGTNFRSENLGGGGFKFENKSKSR